MSMPDASADRIFFSAKKRKCGDEPVATEEQIAAARNIIDDCLRDLRVQWANIFSSALVAVEKRNKISMRAARIEIPQSRIEISSSDAGPVMSARIEILSSDAGDVMHARTEISSSDAGPVMPERTEISSSDAGPVMPARIEILSSDAVSGIETLPAAPGIDAHTKECPRLGFDTTAADDFMRVETHGFGFNPYQTDTRSDPGPETRQGCVFSV